MSPKSGFNCCNNHWLSLERGDKEDSEAREELFAVHLLLERNLLPLEKGRKRRGQGFQTCDNKSDVTTTGAVTFRTEPWCCGRIGRGMCVHFLRVCNLKNKQQQKSHVGCSFAPRGKWEKVLHLLSVCLALHGSLEYGLLYIAG